MILKYKYTTAAIGQIRKVYNLKTCYRTHLDFLKYKDSNSKSLANRIVKNSNYLCSFKDLNYFFILYLRSSLTNKINSKVFNLSVKNPNNSFFIDNYKQYLALNDLNRALLWRLLQINSIYKLYTTVKKKKKKLIYTNRLKFIENKFRILISWTWLKLFIKSFSKKNIDKLYYSLDKFLNANPNHQILTDIKFKVYKLQLLRTL